VDLSAHLGFPLDVHDASFAGKGFCSDSRWFSKAVVSEIKNSKPVHLAHFCTCCVYNDGIFQSHLPHSFLNTIDPEDLFVQSLFDMLAFYKVALCLLRPVVGLPQEVHDGTELR